MNEEQVRTLVRRIVSERMAGGPAARRPSPFARPEAHASHGMLRMAPSVEKGQPCVIEPQVACGLCGFCQSLGH
jgi:hypothetical protein